MEHVNQREGATRTGVAATCADNRRRLGLPIRLRSPASECTMPSSSPTPHEVSLSDEHDAVSWSSSSVNSTAAAEARRLSSWNLTSLLRRL
jgi:hypothetical protein